MAIKFRAHPVAALWVPLILAATLLPAGWIDAQLQPEVSASFLLGFPRGEFREHVPNVGFGIEFTGGVHLGRSPLLLGAELGFLTYGRDSRREYFSLTIQEVTVRVITTNNILLGNLFLRLQPPSGSVRPYLDALIGFKYFFTETRIRSIYYDDDEPIARDTNLGDIASAHGYGVGIAIDLWSGEVDFDEGPSGWMGLQLDLGVRYMLGSEAEYLKKGSINYVDGRVVYEVERSMTDFLRPHVGVRFIF